MLRSTQRCQKRSKTAVFWKMTSWEHVTSIPCVSCNVKFSDLVSDIVSHSERDWPSFHFHDFTLILFFNSVTWLKFLPFPPFHLILCLLIFLFPGVPELEFSLINNVRCWLLQECFLNLVILYYAEQVFPVLFTTSCNCHLHWIIQFFPISVLAFALTVIFQLLNLRFSLAVHSGQRNTHTHTHTHKYMYIL